MQLRIEGRVVNAASGGRAPIAGQPVAVLLHGAGMDHTVWALQSRWLAFHGWNVLALDLPGHGASGGPPLPAIPALAHWLLSVLQTLEVAQAGLVGHSMGALIALEAASLAPDRVTHLVLIGAAATMPVHSDLLAAARADDPAAIDMVNIWGHGFRAGLGAGKAPGVWMTGIGARLLERAAPGVLFADLSACNDYAGGKAAAARVAAPALVICGERDLMTPLKQGRALAAALGASSLLALRDAGHMLPAECPDEVRDAIARHLRTPAPHLPPP